MVAVAEAHPHLECQPRVLAPKQAVYPLEEGVYDAPSAEGGGASWVVVVAREASPQRLPPSHVVPREWAVDDLVSLAV